MTFPWPIQNRSRTLHRHQGGGRENLTTPCNRIKPVVTPFQPTGIAITIPFTLQQRRHAPLRLTERLFINCGALQPFREKEKTEREKQKAHFESCLFFLTQHILFYFIGCGSKYKVKRVLIMADDRICSFTCGKIVKLRTALVLTQAFQVA